MEKRKISEEEKQDKKLSQLITEYNESYNRILGYRHMKIYINIFTQTSCSQKYIHRLMKVLKIKARSGLNKLRGKSHRNFEVKWQNQK